MERKQKTKSLWDDDDDEEMTIGDYKVIMIP